MFEVDLGPILGRFGPDLGPKMAPKSPPKTTQKRTKKQLKKTTKKTTKMTKKIFPRRHLPGPHRAPLPPTPPLPEPQASMHRNSQPLSASSKPLSVISACRPRPRGKMCHISPPHPPSGIHFVEWNATLSRFPLRSKPLSVISTCRPFSVLLH